MFKKIQCLKSSWKNPFSLFKCSNYPSSFHKMSQNNIQEILSQKLICNFGKVFMYRDSSNRMVFGTKKSVLLEEVLWYKLVNRGFEKSKVPFFANFLRILTCSIRCLLQIYSYMIFISLSSEISLAMVIETMYEDQMLFIFWNKIGSFCFQKKK